MSGETPSSRYLVAVSTLPVVYIGMSHEHRIATLVPHTFSYDMWPNPDEYPHSDCCSRQQPMLCIRCNLYLVKLLQLP